ncbi:MAG: hypothetical protein IK130_07540 [Oscillospiraceae bacterium]|nr:hypothetical protein [Oscillospiraceae bacterium]
MQREKPDSAWETVRRFLLTACGSIFVQVFCWAIYSYLSMSTWMCGLSVLFTALLYHFVQLNEETGLSRRNVFLAAILLPFLLGAGITVHHLFRYPQLNLLGAELDSVSPLTETVSLYAARLLINGVILCIFAAADRIFRKDRENGGKTE